MKSLIFVVLVSLTPQSFATQSNEPSAAQPVTDRLRDRYQSTNAAGGTLVDFGLQVSGVRLQNVASDQYRNASRSGHIINQASSIMASNKKTYQAAIAAHQSQFSEMTKLLQKTVDEIDPKSSEVIRARILIAEHHAKTHYERLNKLINEASSFEEFRHAIGQANDFTPTFDDELLSPIQRMKNAPAAAKAIDRFNLAYSQFRSKRIILASQESLDSLVLIHGIKKTAEEGVNPSIRLAKRLSFAGKAITTIGILDLALRTYEGFSSEGTEFHFFPLIQLPLEALVGESEVEEHARAETQVKPVVYSPLLSPQELRASSTVAR